MEATHEATAETSKRTIAIFKEDETKPIEFLMYNERLFNKRLMDYKDPIKREAQWDKVCA